MSTKMTSEKADEYFSVLNPIAMKIKLDINETKLCYEHIWEKLSINEQIDIINETIIKPEIALRYFDLLDTNEEAIETNYLYDCQNLSTFNKIKTGQKIILDDLIGDYRDVHSSPFSFKTKSQLNLNLFHNLLEPATTKVPKTIIETSSKIKKSSPMIGTPPPPPISGAKKNSENIKYSKMIETLPAAADNPSQNFIAKFIGNLNTKRFVKNDEEEQNLVSVGLNSLSLVPSDEEGSEMIDDGKNVEEFKRLLEENVVKEGYDFLNNW